MAQKRLAGTSKFFKEVRFELKKVAWPTRQQVITSTIVVLVAVTLITLFIGGMDYILARVWRVITASVK